MNNKNKYLLVFLFIVCILSISAISATENTTSKEITRTNSKEYNNLETINHQYDDVSHSNENVELKDEENINNVKLIKDIHSNNNKKEEAEKLNIHSNNNKKEEEEKLKGKHNNNNTHNNNNEKEELEIKGSNENVELKDEENINNVKLIKDIHSKNDKKEYQINFF